MMLKKLLVASHNQGKIKEIRRLLEPYGTEVLSAADLQLPDVEETGTTFAENAALKAKELARLSSMTCLADDSGLCVDALGGRPGVYSARYAPERDFAKGMAKLLTEMAASGNPSRAAHFSCVLALAEPDGNCRFFEGRVDGRLLEAPRGNGGFGYDPLFMPEGRDVTFAEMDGDEKNKISHRGRAFQKFIKGVYETADAAL